MAKVEIPFYLGKLILLGKVRELAESPNYPAIGDPFLEFLKNQQQQQQQQQQALILNIPQRAKITVPKIDLLFEVILCQERLERLVRTDEVRMGLAPAYLNVRYVGGW